VEFSPRTFHVEQSRDHWSAWPVFHVKQVADLRRIQPHVPHGTSRAVFRLAPESHSFESSECSTWNFLLSSRSLRLRGITPPVCSTWNVATKKSFRPTPFAEILSSRDDRRNVPRGTKAQGDEGRFRAPRVLNCSANPEDPCSTWNIPPEFFGSF
jgi:hypothetical protein